MVMYISEGLGKIRSKVQIQGLALEVRIAPLLLDVNVRIIFHWIDTPSFPYCYMKLPSPLLIL